MSRKVYVNVIVKMVATLDDDTNLSDFINDMDYNFRATEGGQIEDTEILDYDVKDSK